MFLFLKAQGLMTEKEADELFTFLLYGSFYVNKMMGLQKTTTGTDCRDGSYPSSLQGFLPNLQKLAAAGRIKECRFLFQQDALAPTPLSKRKHKEKRCEEMKAFFMIHSALFIS